MAYNILLFCLQCKALVTLDVDLECAVEKLGVPIPKEYLNPTTRGSVILNGVNYASGAGGILDSTGSNYVSNFS